MPIGSLRDSSVDLTMNVYTDPKLLDVHGALDVLPRLPLDGGSHKRETATGTEGGPRQFAPGFAPNSGTDRQSGANADNQGRGENESGRECFSPVSPDDVKRKEPLSSADNGSSKSGRLDLNQRPLRPETRNPVLQNFPKVVCLQHDTTINPFCKPLQNIAKNCEQ